MFSGSFARLAPRPHTARKFVETGLGFRSGGIVLVLAGAWLFLAQSLVAGTVVDFLSNVEEHISHGRLILARELKQNCVPPLTIVELAETDAFWQLLWELYVRCEVYLKLQPPKAKLIETGEVSITLN